MNVVAASRANLEMQNDRGEKVRRAVRRAGGNREENEGPTIYLFIYLTTPALRCSTEIFRCGTQALGCGMWDLVP